MFALHYTEIFDKFWRFLIANGYINEWVNVFRIFGLPMDGSKLIHIAIGASAMRTDEYTDNNDLSAKSTLAKQIGVALATNRKIVRCDLS
jgi:hypothetical protein